MLWRSFKPANASGFAYSLGITKWSTIYFIKHNFPYAPGFGAAVAQFAAHQNGIANPKNLVIGHKIGIVANYYLISPTVRRPNKEIWILHGFNFADDAVMDHHQSWLPIKTVHKPGRSFRRPERAEKVRMQRSFGHRVAPN